MSETKEPVVQYLWMEGWQYESGGFGWQIKDANGQVVNREKASDLLLEMAEWMLGGDGGIIASVLLHRSGRITTRRLPDLDITTRREYVWLRSNLTKSVMCQIGHDLPFSRVYSLLYSLEWLYHLARGRFRARRGPRYAAATPVAPSLTETLTEASEPAQNPSQGRGGRVLKFRKPE